MQDYVKRVLLGKVEEHMKFYNADNWLALRSDTIILFMDNRDSKIDMEKFCGRLLEIFQGKPNLSVSIRTLIFRLLKLLLSGGNITARIK